MLAPETMIPGVRASYRYGFYAVEDGEHVVAFDYGEYSVRRTAASATVTFFIVPTLRMALLFSLLLAGSASIE